MSFLLKRDLELYVSTVDTGFTTSNTYKISVMDNFSWNTLSRSSKSDIKRISDTPERLPFTVTDEISPTTLKMTTYAKPVMNGGNHSCVEKLLFDSLCGAATTEGASEYSLGFASVNELIPLYIYISLDGNNYKLSGSVVKTADFKFSIDTLTSIDWNIEAQTFSIDATLPDTYTDHTAVTNYLKNKLSIISAVRNGTTYQLPIIGGNLKITNKVKFPQRKTLDVTVSTPLPHIVEGRSVTGVLSCYMHMGVGQSGNFYEDAHDDYSLINTATNITGYMGGKTVPYLYFNIPNSVIELPKNKTEDAISFEFKFDSRELNFGTNDDIVLQYKVQ